MVNSPENRPSPALMVFFIVPVVDIIVALLMILSDAAQKIPPALPEDIQAASAALIDFAAPDFELADLEGQPVKLTDYRGRVLFLNFWQTTCEPCIRELPALAEFAAQQGASGAAVLTINFEETAQQVRDFLAKHDIPVLPVVLDPTSSVRRLYGVVAIPRTFVIDAAGIVRAMKIGEITLEEMEAYLEQVTAAGQELSG